MTKPITTIIEEEIKAGNNAWSNFVAAIKADGHVIKNWMFVRGQLQAMNDCGVIVRVASVHVEEYELV